ncbi:MAG TPA: aspartate kinase, partial [Cellvibrionaceae bacterium]
MTHTVEKIGGTSMNEYEAVRDNVILKGKKSPTDIYNRIFVVSAYGGMTDLLLENKRNSNPGVYGLFASTDNDDDWQAAFDELKKKIYAMNRDMFGKSELGRRADAFIAERLDDAERCLKDLQRLCQHGHFELQSHLFTVREMLASIGEAHSAWNMAHLLERDGIKARFIDLSGWQASETLPLDEKVTQSFASADYDNEILIATGYAHCKEGLMGSFDRGY